jgi:hypothetical protein
VNERWVCKRCFSDNDGSAGACARCGLTRGAESSLEDQQSWAAQAGVPGPTAPTPLWRNLLRYWWIPALAVVLLVGYLTTARRGDDGAVAGAGSLSVYDLQVGDCFNSGTEEEIDNVDAVPCSQPHAYEVFAVADYNGAEYPATDLQFEEAFFEVCVPPFEDYVGVPYEDSVLWASAITPTQAGWDDGDHEFVCHLHQDPGVDQIPDPLTGSMRGSDR